MTETDRLILRRTVRFFYDAQKLRIQFQNRATTEVETTELTDKDKAFLDKAGDGLKGVERATLNEIKRLLKNQPIWTTYLKETRGIGPTLAGVLVAFINIENARTVSSLWKWCGLAVVDGAADRRRKGQKASFNPWLKSKMIKVLAESFIKTNSPWRKIYDDRKHRRRHQLVDPCMACQGTGKVTFVTEYDAAESGGEDTVAKKNGKPKVCTNCEGRGKGPWGKSDAHRDLDAKRYMVKMFLADLWNHWRTLEGLSIRPTYAEEKLGRVHGAP